MKTKEFKVSDFRKELIQVLPGYKWTVAKYSGGQYFEASGFRSSGFNRMSTLKIFRENKDGLVLYAAKLWGYGRRSPLVAEVSNFYSLRRVIRSLQ